MFLEEDKFVLGWNLLPLRLYVTEQNMPSRDQGDKSFEDEDE